MSSIWRFFPEKKIKHPAPFPLQLPLRCIYSVLDEKKGCIVIDPYVGSGTTVVAAKMLGHKYIGIDISKNYVDMIKERVENYELEREAFNAEVSKHFVKETFKDRKNRGIYNHHNKKRKVELKNSLEQSMGLLFNYN